MERMRIGLLHLEFPIHLSNFRAKNTPKVGLLRPKTMHKHFLNNSKTSLKMSKTRLSKLKKTRNNPSKRSRRPIFDLRSPFSCLFINVLSWNIQLFLWKGPTLEPLGPDHLYEFYLGPWGPLVPNPLYRGSLIVFSWKAPQLGAREGLYSLCSQHDPDARGPRGSLHAQELQRDRGTQRSGDIFWGPWGPTPLTDSIKKSGELYLLKPRMMPKHFLITPEKVLKSPENDFFDPQNG